MNWYCRSWKGLWYYAVPPSAEELGKRRHGKWVPWGDVSAGLPPCPRTWRPSQALRASSSSPRIPSAWPSCLARASSRRAASASRCCSSLTSGAGSPGCAVALVSAGSGQRDLQEVEEARFQASRAPPAAAVARNTAAPHKASSRHAHPGSGSGTGSSPCSAMLLSTALAPDGHEHLIGTLGWQGHPRSTPPSSWLLLEFIGRG